MNFDIKGFFLKILNRILSGARLAAGFLVLITVPLFTIYYSYTTDVSGFFQGDLVLREVANMVLSGTDIIGYEQLNNSERDIMKIFASEIDPVPEVITLGSSRILQLTSDIVGTDSYFNCAMTGGDAADVLGTFYLFDEDDRLPETIVIGFDPWLLRDDEGNGGWDRRSDKELYTEFLNAKLGYNIVYEKEDDSAAYEALFSPNYFQDNITYTLRDSANIEKPIPVVGDLYSQATEVKRADGTLLYDATFRERSQIDINNDALYQTENLLHMQDYPELGTLMPEVMDEFFAYAQTRNVNIIIVLAPFHPITYDFVESTAQTDPLRYGGFLATEPKIRELAEKYNIPVYGSYNPHLIEGITEEDFFDGLHCKESAFIKIFENETLLQHAGLA